MDYSKMSDKEINKRVAFALGCKEVMPDIFMDDNRRYEFDKPKNKSGNRFYFDPCNNIIDAWPIIVKNRISIDFDSDGSGELREEWVTASNQYFSGYLTCEKALRAAMIVFLKMQEPQNAKIPSERDS